jgi:hypothetical protein
LAAKALRLLIRLSISLIFEVISTFKLLHTSTIPALTVYSFASVKLRLDYVDNPPQSETDEDQAIVERVKQRRGDAGLLELDLSLLHAPAVADGW